MEQPLIELSPEEMEAALRGTTVSKTEPVKTEPVVTTEPTKTEPVKTEPAKTEPVVTTEPAKVEPVKTEPVLSFDQQLETYLSEKTGGKYKKFEDIESELKAPKAEFADDHIKHLNDLAKKGVKLDKEFFELQNLNLEGDANGKIDTEFVLLETMKRKDETKGLSQKTLLNELNKKYNYAEWKDKEETDFTDEDFANKEIMLRDAQKDLDWLTNYKQERTFAKEPNPEELRLQQESERLAIQNYERMVQDELFSKITNLTTEIQIDKDKKEVFNYKLSEADRTWTADMMKLLPVSTKVYFDQFLEKGEDGKMRMNHQKVFESMVKSRTFDQAVENALKDGIAIGAKNYVKDELKNVKFTPTDSNVGNPVAKTEAEAIALAIKANNTKL